MKTMTWSTWTSGGEPGGPIKPRWCGPHPGRATHALFLLKRHQSCVLILDSNSWLKTPIKGTPRRSRGRRARKHINAKINPVLEKIGGGKRRHSLRRWDLYLLQYLCRRCLFFVSTQLDRVVKFDLGFTTGHGWEPLFGWAEKCPKV
jgi:hypothetical protein